jgi:hypothetical protein
MLADDNFPITSGLVTETQYVASCWTLRSYTHRCHWELMKMGDVQVGEQYHT